MGRNTLQRTATHGSILQGTLFCNGPKHTVKHCNTLQHMVVHVSTSRHLFLLLLLLLLLLLHVLHL